jgi:hypothetical protein
MAANDRSDLGSNRCILTSQNIEAQARGGCNAIILSSAMIASNSAVPLRPFAQSLMRVHLCG